MSINHFYDIINDIKNDLEFFSHFYPAQSCLTLCNLMDYIVHAILQARILEWVAFPFSRGSSQPRPPTLQSDSLRAEPQGKNHR